MHFFLIAILLGIFTFINILAPVSGSATVTPVLTGLVGAKDAVAVATVFFFLTCIPRVYLFRKYIRWNIVKQLWPISIIGALCGGFIFAGVPEQVIAIIIFCFLAWFLYQKAIASFGKKKKEKKPTKHGVMFVGFLSGALQGTGLAGSDLRNGYLLSKGLTIPEIHGTTALIGGSNFLFASLVRLQSGDLTVHMALPILALFPVIVLATWVGRHATLKMPKVWQDRISLGIMIFAMVMIVKELLK
jgi:uncharacterized membrane protein YfcA